jgi:hypothetical protein
MTKRAHISLETKLASALLALGHVPYSDAKLMSARQIVSLYHFDHGILHAIKPINEPWNLTPRLIAEHRTKSRKDTSAVAKTKRLTAAKVAHDRFIATGEKPPVPGRQKRKLKSRGFEQGHRPLRGRGFEQRRAP